MKTKILHVMYSLKFSGAEIMYVDASEDFKQKGCDLTVLATNNDLGEFSAKFSEKGYKVLHRPISSSKYIFKYFRDFLSLFKFLKKENYDTIHIHVHKYLVLFSFLSFLTNSNAVYTFHSVFSSRSVTLPYHIFKRWLCKNIFKCKFQTISDSVFNHEKKYFRNNTTKIYNWYSSKRFYPASITEKNEIREKLNIGKKTFVIISVGGCSHIKRHDHIIKSIPILLKELPNFLYLHLGSGSDEENEKKLVQDLGLDSNIRFLGNKRELRKYLIASDVYVMTSKFEGISISTVEAMACKIPSVLYNVQGLKDFNKNGENSIQIEENYRTLAQTLVNIENNSLNTKEIVDNAFAFVQANFDMTKNSSKIYNLYLK